MQALRRLWSEERACAPLTAWFFVATVLMLGSAAGLVAVQRTLVSQGLIPAQVSSTSADQKR